MAGKDELEKRITELEERLSLIENTTLVRGQLLQARAFKLGRERDAKAKLKAEKLRADAAPKRLEHFERFVEARLLTGPGRRTTEAHVFASYENFLDEVQAAALERLTPPELYEALAGLPGVSRGVVPGRHCDQPGLIGARVREEYQDPHDATDDTTLVSEHKQRLNREARNQVESVPA